MILIAIAPDVKGLNDIHNRLSVIGAELSIVGMPTTALGKTTTWPTSQAMEMGIPIIKNRVMDLQHATKMMYAVLEILNSSDGFARVYLTK